MQWRMVPAKALSSKRPQLGAAGPDFPALRKDAAAHCALFEAPPVLSNRAATFPPATDFLDVLCTLDADAITDLLAPDALLSIGGSVLFAGKTKINRALKRGISSLMWLRCEPAATWSQDSVHVIDADLSCERVDGSRAAFPATVILRFRGRLIVDIRLFVYDPAPLAGFLS